MGSSYERAATQDYFSRRPSNFRPTRSIRQHLDRLENALTSSNDHPIIVIEEQSTFGVDA